MTILDYNKKSHKQIIDACVKALKAGRTVAYPTDTSYGLGVDATNIKAIKKLYQVKGRSFNKAVSVVVPSVAYAKKIVKWGAATSHLAKKFWPGALTLVLGIKYKGEMSSFFDNRIYSMLL
jgi:L-threonylcarbamoyladenylate synthase